MDLIVRYRATITGAPIAEFFQLLMGIFVQTLYNPANNGGWSGIAVKNERMWVFALDEESVIVSRIHDPIAWRWYRREGFSRRLGAVGHARGGTLCTHRTSGCALLVVLLISATGALAHPMHVLASTPAAEAIIHGGNAQYVVHFDGPVDHAQSRLEILRDGRVVQRLDPLLDSAADVLFASAPAPEPGHYVLHWVVKSVPDADISDGMVPFSVTQ